MHAHVIDNTIVATGLPGSARRLDTGEWVLALADADTATQEACGWYEVVDTPRPDDTPTTTHDQSYQLIDGVPTVVWTERPKSEFEMGQVPDGDRLVAAELAYRSAYDEVIAAGSLSMSRINAANRAGSDARLAALEG